MRPAAAVERLEERTLLTAYVVDTLSDTVAADGKLSLREAVQASNTNLAVNEAAAGQSGVTDSITFDASLAFGTITLAGSRLDVTGALKIDGLGSSRLTVSGSNAVQIFAVAAGANLSVSGLTLTHGFGANTIDTFYGGAIYNLGTLSLTGVAVTDSKASFRGAAIYNEGTVTMTGGSVLRSSGTAAVENFRGTFSAANVQFADNAAGAIHNWATVLIDASTFARNTASSGGAAEHRQQRGGRGTPPAAGGPSTTSAHRPS